MIKAHSRSAISNCRHQIPFQVMPSFHSEINFNIKWNICKNRNNISADNVVTLIVLRIK